MTEKRKRKIFAGGLLLASIALLLFGIAEQILCEGVTDDRYFLKYLLGLIPAAGTFMLLYWATASFRKSGKVLRVLIILLLIVVFLQSALYGLAVAVCHLEEDQFIVYAMYAWTYPREEVRYMLGKSHMFGHGEPYYEYPDAIMEGYERRQDDLPLDVKFAFDERDRAEVVFDEFRTFRTIPVLSYFYGLWVRWVFALLTTVWCAAALCAGLLLCRRREKLMYYFCYVLLAVQLVLPLLEAFGKINCWISHPFAANWGVNACYVAPQLGIMLALVRAGSSGEEPAVPEHTLRE